MINPMIERRELALQRLRVAVQQRVSAEMATVASTAQFSAIVDDVVDAMVFRLQAQVLAEQLPPQTADHLVRVATTDPRYATWWDHFKDTHQNRWWMRWRSWSVRYVQKPVSVERVVTVNVRDNWTYPRAAIALPEDRFGSPVMVSLLDITDRAWRP